VQFVAGDNVSIGLSATLNVNFAPGYAGRTVTLYRYSTAQNGLVRVASTVISSSNRASFQGVTSGGDFVIVFS
jgi:hypothetical protein